MKADRNSIIAFVLVIVIAFGAILLALGKGVDFDNSFGDFFNKSSKDTSADTSKDTTTDTSSSGANTTTTARYIDADGYGYQTTAGVTAFFKTLKIPEEDKSYEAASKDGFTCGYYYYSTKAYDTFVLNVKWSTDGILWNDFRYNIVNDTEFYQGDFMGKCSDDIYGVDTIVYISYTFVTNCVNPVEVLRDLKNNVFTVDDMFEPWLLYDKKPSSDALG